MGHLEWGGNFSGPKGPGYVDILNCMHCGLCLPHCPTYALFGLEKSSPRGRIALLRAVAEGELTLTDGLAEEMYLCLGCRACETACPAGVKYGELLEAARVQVERNQYGSRLWRLVKRRALDLFLSPRKMRRVGKLLRLYQRGGLQWLVRKTGLLRLLNADLAALEKLLPPLPPRFSSETIPEVTPPQGEKRARVGMLTGCVADLFMAPENEATVRVLAINGCEVVTPPAQRCCGALHAHLGEMEAARELARHNIAVFEEANVDAVVLNSAGCGAAMKEYHRWLGQDPEWAERAQRFGAKVKDLSEFLLALGLNRRDLHPLECRATYDDACHLAHGQGITEEPRRLLQAIPGLELIELPEASWCCGSAGIYNLIHFREARQLLERKMKHVQSTGAELLLTGNPGCLFQLRYGVQEWGLNVRVEHTVTVLDWAYHPHRRPEEFSRPSPDSE